MIIRFSKILSSENLKSKNQDIKSCGPQILIKFGVDKENTMILLSLDLDRNPRSVNFDILISWFSRDIRFLEIENLKIRRYQSFDILKISGCKLGSGKFKLTTLSRELLFWPKNRIGQAESWNALNFGPWLSWKTWKSWKSPSKVSIILYLARQKRFWQLQSNSLA